MTTVKAIHIDMDNTLVKWTDGINAELRKIAPFLSIKLLDKLPYKFRQFVISRIYKKLGSSFWANLEHTDNIIYATMFAVSRIRTIDPNISIGICSKLSGIMDSTDERNGKLRSILNIEERFGFKFDHIILVPNHESKLDHIDKYGRSVLIDNYHKNIAELYDTIHDGILVKDDHYNSSLLNVLLLKMVTKH